MRKSIIFGLVFLLTLSFVNAFYCYQESANVSTECGGLATGKYNWTSSNPSAWEWSDGNWTSVEGLGSSDYYVNYTMPSGKMLDLSSLIAQFQNAGGITTNYTMNLGACPNSQNILQIRIRSRQAGNYHINVSCYNTTTWHLLYEDIPDLGLGYFWEEAVNWSINLNSSLNITLYNELNAQPYTIATNITFINQDENYSVNYTITGGALNISTIEPGLYNAIFYSNESNPRSIFIKIPESKDYYPVKLFILESTDAYLQKYYVLDENGNPVSNAYVNISKYFSTGYQSVGYYKTDINGLAGIEKSDFSKYKEVVIYNDVQLVEDSYFYIYFLYGESKTFKVALAQDYIGDLIDVSSIQINYTEETITWFDYQNSIDGICIDIFYENLTRYAKECYNGTYGSTTYNSSALPSDNNYILQFLITKGEEYYHSTNMYSNKETISDLQVIFYFFLFMILLFVLFVYIDWRLALIISIPTTAYIFIRTRLLNINPLFIKSSLWLIIAVIVAFLFKGKAGAKKNE